MAAFWRLSVTISCFLAAGLVVAAETGPSTSAAPEVVEGEARALAGDMLMIGERVIRLFALRAPRRNVTYGPPSRAALHDLIAGKPVSCTVVDEDRRGRLVARCRAGGRDLSAARIRGGWAFPQRRLTAEYDAAEMEARREERGFWGGAERSSVAQWTWNFAAILAGALVAGLIGLFTVRLIRAIERRDETLGLASALGGEIQVIGELLDVDADLGNLDGADAAKEVLARIDGARTVFDGSVGRLGHLAHPIPDQLVRFYGRVQAKVRRMEWLATYQGFFDRNSDDTWRRDGMRGEYEEARQFLRLEANTLLDDLHTFLGA